MRTVAILPVKSFGRAKQRLGDAVPDKPALAAAMVADVLEALARVPELDELIVVTAETAAADTAREAGARVIHDPLESGQSAAAALGLAAATDAHRALLVPGDCPALDPSEVSALLAPASVTPTVVIVPDRHGQGTNALLLTPPRCDGAGVRRGVVRSPCCARPRGGSDGPGRRPSLAGARRRHARGPRHAARRPRRRAADPRTARRSRRRVIELLALPGLPEVRAGDDLATLLVATGTDLRSSDVIVIAHKVVSKAEGRIVRLADVTPGDRATALAAEHGKDPRHVEVILSEAAEIVRADAGRIICRTRHGFVCANAGVDASNASEPDSLILLPVDPDASARAIRSRLPEGPAVVITDSFGRAWRQGQCEVAIGIAGLAPLQDWRGLPDSAGRELHATVIAIADEAAAAADLVREKDSREPAVRLRGLGRHVTADDGAGVAALVRRREDDLFR